MLIDNFNRKIEYIRISVTRNCNFRCQYCMPNTPDYIEENLIPLDKMLEFLKIAMDFGIKKVRITGGEPLLRKDLPSFISGIYNYKDNIEVALTTNGYLLKKYAKDLKNAGLKRINISLDSLKKERVIKISKRDGLESVLSGIEEAKKCGFKIKINMVPLKNINDDEILDMLDYAIVNNYTLRYIEFMENQFANDNLSGYRSSEILNIISKKYEFNELQEPDSYGPAKNYKLVGSNAIFGIIAPHGDSFCNSCNRIRLTSDGVIYPCLYFEDAVNAREAIESSDNEAMKKALLSAIYNKPEKNRWQENIKSSRAFYYTGG